MMDAVSNNEQYLKKYARYNNMKIYSDVAAIIEIINESEVFMCAYDTNQHAFDFKELFCVVKNNNNSYHKVSIQCNDDNGICNNGQWYTHVTIQRVNVCNMLSRISTTEFENLTNVIAILILQNIDTDNPLYAFVTETWLCRSCNGNMCLPNIASELIKKLNEI